MAQATPEVRKKIADTDVLMTECTALEKKLTHLRAQYDMYFLGEMRAPPSREHETFKKRMDDVRKQFVNQTAARFRLQSLEAKFHSYERLWARNLEEIERGVFRRDVVKLKRKKTEPAAEAPVPSSLDSRPTEISEVSSLGHSVPVATHLGQDDAPTMNTSMPSRTAQNERGNVPVMPAKATAELGLSEEKMKALYGAYLTAKKQCHEDVSKLTYEGLAASIKKQLPGLIQQHQAKSIDFKVVIREGKAVLRAVPKNE